MRGFWQGLLAQVIAAFIPLIIVGVVGYVAWRKLFGGKTAADVVSETVSAAASIPSGLVSMAGSALRGESEGTYITDAEMRQRAAANLATKLAGRTT